MILDHSGATQARLQREHAFLRYIHFIISVLAEIWQPNDIASSSTNSIEEETYNEAIGRMV